MAARLKRSGALHAVEIRDGRAVWYQRQESEADAGVFWHAGSILALPEAGIPLQYSRFLEPEEFGGGLTVPIASHVHRLAADGGRLLFGVDDGSHEDGTDVDDRDGIFLRLGEWDAAGALRAAQSVELERATWQHDIGVTAGHGVFIESPTSRLTTRAGCRQPGARSDGCPGPRVGSGWCAGMVAVAPVRRMRRRCAGYGSTPVWSRTCWGPSTSPTERSCSTSAATARRSRPTRRHVGLRRRCARTGALRNRRDVGRAGTLAHCGRAGRTCAGRRAVRGVRTDGRLVRGGGVSLRLRPRDGAGGDPLHLGGVRRR